MKHRRLFPTALLALLVLPALAQCQQLTVQPEPGKQVVLARADIETLQHIKVTTSASGTSATFEGVALGAVLEKAGVGFGQTMKGKRLAPCLLVEAADGYRVVIALPELDPAFTDKQIILALSKDGKPLDEKEGPYRIVIPDERRMARWVRQVTTLKVVDVQ
ncbi:MAG TPA: molybdopterin-dependent oxidoreductase [Terriglobales bacterium]|nr:molybdopterin-dependent oxidoreductase [Terriglobales bacterium]